MATRTVRLDEEAEQVLEEVRAATGLPISEALKAGLRSLHLGLKTGDARRAPYDIYKELDLGPGGYAIGSSRDVRATVRRVLRKKRGR